MESLIQDLRFTLRQLSTHKGFLATVIVTLALCLGANTTIFTILNALLGATVPVEAPDRLVNVHTVDWENPQALTGVSLPNYEDYRERNTVFAGLVAVVGASVNMI